MNTTSSSSATAGLVRRSVQAIGAWVKAHRPLVSWLAWSGFVLLCVAWVQLYYQPPAGPLWIGKTLRVTVLMLVGLVVREWLALRWEHDPAPMARRRTVQENADHDD